mmetsp:Transcript_10854/g.19775  ORF Transcript_10854/g.19775 Transcript_10854/m.19775 type:complete len:203 (-) Transcript_10854:423-1031(-)
MRCREGDAEDGGEERGGTSPSPPLSRPCFPLSSPSTSPPTSPPTSPSRALPRARAWPLARGEEIWLKNAFSSDPLASHAFPIDAFTSMPFASDPPHPSIFPTCLPSLPIPSLPIPSPLSPAAASIGSTPPQSSSAAGWSEGLSNRPSPWLTPAPLPRCSAAVGDCLPPACPSASPVPASVAKAGTPCLLANPWTNSSKSPPG